VWERQVLWRRERFARIGSRGENHSVPVKVLDFIVKVILDFRKITSDFLGNGSLG
jgi:hypothetical protein